jgi:hypothetical protein
VKQQKIVHAPQHTHKKKKGKQNVFNTRKWQSLIHERDQLATSVVLLGLLVVHDAKRSREDQVTKLTRRQQQVAPLLHLRQLDVKARRNHTALVDAANQLNNDLAVAVIVDDLKLADVA